MNAIKSGYRAEFQTAYLQREIRLLATVAGGIDAGLRNPDELGYGVGRLVKITGSTDADRAVVAATGVTATSIGDATHIIAQSDDTVREVPSDYNYPERYTTLPNLICKNSTEPKTIAVYKIVNADDVKIVEVSEPVTVKTATNVSGTFTLGPATFRLVQTGVNSFKVLGTAPYESTPIVSGNPAGNYLYLKLVNSKYDSDSTKGNYATAVTVGSSDITYKRISALSTHTLTKSDIASEISSNKGIECEICINGSKEVTLQVIWEGDKFSTYTFDLSNLALEANG